MIHKLAHPVEKISNWATHMFIYRYRDWPYDKAKLLDSIYKETKKQKTDIDSNIAQSIKTEGLKESKFNFLEKVDEYPILEKFSEFFMEALANVVMHGLPSIDKRLALPERITQVNPVVFESWYHVTNDGGAHGVHCHPGASWAGIFYIETSGCNTDTLSGVNRWYNIESNKGPGDLGSMWWNADNCYAIKPEEGTLVLFPAWMWHEATSYIGNKDRVCIAFNSVIVDGTDEDL